MANLSLIRRLMKLMHQETTHWLGTLFYNSISSTGVFARHYDLLAKDISSYCRQGALLDIGTGPARLLLKLHKAAPSLRLVGIDSSQAMIAKARKHIADAGLNNKIEVKVANAMQMPFLDGSFDIVISTASIHHWKQPSACLNEAYRVLKAGGYALIYDVVSDTPDSILEQARREYGKVPTFFYWFHSFEEPFYTCKNLEALIEPTLFKQNHSRFVGLLYCLILKK